MSLGDTNETGLTSDSRGVESAPAQEHDSPATADVKTLNLYFQQWDRTSEALSDPVPELDERYFLDEDPIVIDVTTAESLVEAIRLLASDSRLPITDIGLVGAHSKDSGEPYFIGCNIGGVSYFGHKQTHVKHDENGFPCGVHWEGENWMYFVGTPETLQSQIRQNTEADTSTVYPDTPMSGFLFHGPNEYIPQGAEAVDITLSWERLAFDYEIRHIVADGKQLNKYLIRNIGKVMGLKDEQ